MSGIKRANKGEETLLKLVDFRRKLMKVGGAVKVLTRLSGSYILLFLNLFIIVLKHGFILFKGSFSETMVFKRTFDFVGVLMENEYFLWI
jgi:hypothetical protein